MAKQCIVTGRKTTVGYNVSKSKRQTKRKVYPNLLQRRLVNPATGMVQRVWISTRGLRTLKKWMSEGKIYDLRTLAGK